MTNRLTEPPASLPERQRAQAKDEARGTSSALRSRLYPGMVLASLMLGLAVAWLAWGRQPADVVAARAAAQRPGLTALVNEVNPPQGYKLPVSYGALGPALIRAGAIDYDKFAAIYDQSGAALSPEQITILKQGSNAPVVINSDNAHFLLNFFWAVGLANRNPILVGGPITQYSQGRIDGFASTGGWTLASKPVSELFASASLIELTNEQQRRLDEVASSVYRPCCDNPTLFPDCNHGMAMLGLLELMASQDASIAEMLSAAKYVNAYWFPRQAIEVALYLKATQHVSFSEIDPRLAVGQELFSGSGYGQMHARLQQQGLLPAAPDSGGNCGA